LWRKVAQTKNRFNFGDARIVVDNGAVYSLVRCHVLQHGGIGDEQSLILAALRLFPFTFSLPCRDNRPNLGEGILRNNFVWFMPEADLRVC